MGTVKSCFSDVIVSVQHTENEGKIRKESGGNLPRPLTSAHALVISQHVASRTHTLIGTKGVNAAEGAQQRILGALVDVWSQERQVRYIYSSKHAKNKCTFGNVSVTV